MKIELRGVSKRFNYEWIFRDLTFDFESGNSYAIIGQNGSGKSTLLKIISGQLSPSEGSVIYTSQKKITAENIYSEVSFTAPYIELVDDFNLTEYLQFHFSFKKVLNGRSQNNLLEISGLQKHRNKSLKTFSSGMKQRVKLVTAILSDTPILLLDEPTSNLDIAGVAWYLQLMEEYKKDRIVIIGSNMEREYHFCNNTLDITDYKS